MKKYLELSYDERQKVIATMLIMYKFSDSETVDMTLIDLNPHIENSVVSYGELAAFKNMLTTKEVTYPNLK